MKVVEKILEKFFLYMFFWEERTTQGLLIKISCMRIENIADHYLFERMKLGSF
jgi:hypothetical protein